MACSRMVDGTLVATLHDREEYKEENNNKLSLFTLRCRLFKTVQAAWTRPKISKFEKILQKILKNIKKNPPTYRIHPSKQTYFKKK